MTIDLGSVRLPECHTYKHLQSPNQICLMAIGNGLNHNNEVCLQSAFVQCSNSTFALNSKDKGRKYNLCSRQHYILQEYGNQSYFLTIGNGLNHNSRVCPQQFTLWLHTDNNCTQLGTLMTIDSGSVRILECHTY